MVIKSLYHIHKCKELYQTLNHEIAHHNGLGEASATAMGKISDFAYNIGTSLNQDTTTHPTNPTNHHLFLMVVFCS